MFNVNISPSPGRSCNPPVRIVMVWSLVLLGMVIYAMMWFVFGAVGMSFIDAVTDSFTFTDQWNTVVELLRNVIYWHPILAMIGWLIWGILNSMRRDKETWEFG